MRGALYNHVTKQFHGMDLNQLKEFRMAVPGEALTQMDESVIPPELRPFAFATNQQLTPVDKLAGFENLDQGFDYTINPITGKQLGNIILDEGTTHERRLYPIIIDPEVTDDIRRLPAFQTTLKRIKEMVEKHPLPISEWPSVFVENDFIMKLCYRVLFCSWVTFIDNHQKDRLGDWLLERLVRTMVVRNMDIEDQIPGFLKALSQLQFL